MDRRAVLVNLTGHPLTILSAGDPVIVASDGKARVQSSMEIVERIQLDGIDWTVPLLSVTESSVVDLPGRRDGVLYVVSGIVAAAVQDRDDVVAPGRVVYKEGKVVGCRAFIQINTR